MREGLARVVAPFKHGYKWLGLSIVLQVFAAGVWLIALVWEVIGLGGGPAQLSVVSTAASLGILLPALLAGVVADRIEQKSILLVVATLELTGMAIVAALAAFDLTQLWHLTVISFVTGAAMSFHYPAWLEWRWGWRRPLSPSVSPCWRLLAA